MQDSSATDWFDYYLDETLRVNLRYLSGDGEHAERRARSLGEIHADSEGVPA